MAASPAKARNRTRTDSARSLLIPAHMNEQVKAATEEMRELTDEQLRERIVRLAFGGDWDRFELFVNAAKEALPDDVAVLLRGSAVIGVQVWRNAVERL